MGELHTVTIILEQQWPVTGVDFRRRSLRLNGIRARICLDKSHGESCGCWCCCNWRAAFRREFFARRRILEPKLLAERKICTAEFTIPIRYNAKIHMDSNTGVIMSRCIVCVQSISSVSFIHNEQLSILVLSSGFREVLSILRQKIRVLSQAYCI